MNAATQAEVANGPVAEASAPVLEVAGLTISVRGEDDEREVVSELSFSLTRGETLCIAGESGSGKSMTALGIMGLLPRPAAHVSAGSIRLGDLDLAKLPESRMRPIRGDRIAMIFQEPMTSLNPVLSIGRQLIEAIEAHTPLSRREARQRAIEALKSVRISEAERRLDQYPHELSGGMRQRVMIAMALALKPDILIADEPTTALDVTVQGEVLELLRDLQRETGTALILITHDMGVVAEMADRVIVMRNGMAVEQGDVMDIFTRPQTEYTRELLAAVPTMRGAIGARPELPKSVGTRECAEAPRGASTPVAEVRDLQVRFDLRGGFLGRVDRQVRAVEGVSFAIGRDETLALVDWRRILARSSLTAAACARSPQPNAMRSGATCKWSFRTPMPRSTRACG
jgi:peptide/nickel transport system ATP-binding protein